MSNNRPVPAGSLTSNAIIATSRVGIMTRSPGPRDAVTPENLANPGLHSELAGLLGDQRRQRLLRRDRESV